MKNATGGVLNCLLAMVVAVLAAGAESFAGDLSAGAPPPPIRVGFFEFDGYHMIDAAGARSGYGYEYLQRLAAYGGWKYEYVGFDKSWADMAPMLERGEIDLITGAVKTPARQEKFEFSTWPTGWSSVIMTVKAGNSRYAPGDYVNWNGIRVGMLAGTGRMAPFDALAREKGFTCQFREFRQIDELLQALQRGEIDAAVTGSRRTTDREWIYEQFGFQPVFLMARKGDRALLDKINAAQIALERDDPQWQRDLQVRYYGNFNSGSGIVFSPVERSFIAAAIAAKRVFRVLVQPDFRPYSRIENGKSSGIMEDILALLEERTGLDFRVLGPRDWQEYSTALGKGDCELLLDCRYDYAWAEQMGFYLTPPYLSASVSRLTRKTFSGTPRSIAVLAGTDVVANLRKKNAAEVAVVPYHTVDEVVAAVKNGDQDAAYLYTAVAEAALGGDSGHGLASDIMPGYLSQFAIGIANRADPLLVSIVTKAVRSLSQEDIEQIILKYSVRPVRQFSVRDWISANPIKALLMLLTPLLLLIAALGGILLSRRSAYRKAMVIKKIPCRYFVADYEGRILEYELGSLSGFIPTDRPFRKIADLPDAAMAARALKLIRQVLDDGKPANVEYAFGDSKRSATVSRLPFELFKRDTVVWISQDTTELQNTKENAQMLAERLNLTLQSIGDAVIATAADGRITLVNRVAEALTGWPQAEAVGRPHEEVFRIVGSDDEHVVSSPVWKVLSSGKIMTLPDHTDLVARNGKRYRIADSAAPIRAPEGNIIGAILVFRDVTEDCANRARLQEAVMLLEYAASLVRGASFRLQVKTREVTGSRDLGELWPVENGKLIAPERWVYGEDLAQFNRAFEEMVANGNANANCIDYRSVYYGEMRYYRLRATADRGDARKSGLVGVIQDVTEYNALTRNEKLLKECFERVFRETEPLAAIRQILEIIRAGVGAFGCYLLHLDLDCHTGRCVAEAHIGGDSSLFGPSRPQYKFDLFEPWLLLLKQHRMVMLPNAEDPAQLEQVGSCSAFWGGHHVKSLYCAGVWKDNQLWGDIGVVYLARRVRFSVHDVAFLRSASQLIGLILERKVSQAGLEVALKQAENSVRNEKRLKSCLSEIISNDI